MGAFSQLRFPLPTCLADVTLMKITSQQRPPDQTYALGTGGFLPPIICNPKPGTISCPQLVAPVTCLLQTSAELTLGQPPLARALSLPCSVNVCRGSVHSHHEHAARVAVGAGLAVAGCWACALICSAVGKPRARPWREASPLPCVLVASPPALPVHSPSSCPGGDGRKTKWRL